MKHQNDSDNNNTSRELSTHTAQYKLIEEIKYPYRPPEVVPIEEQIRIETNLLYRLWCTCEIIDDGDYLDLNRLLSVESIKPLVTSVDTLRTLLQQFPQQFEFSEDKTGVKPVAQYSDDEDDDYTEVLTELSQQMNIPFILVLEMNDKQITTFYSFFQFSF